MARLQHGYHEDPKMATLKLSEAHIAAMPLPPPGKNRIDRDTQINGLGVRITSSGQRQRDLQRPCGAHDDLVLALALAVFGLSRPEPAQNVPIVWCR